MFINKNDDFKGWEDWKEKNYSGMECVFSFERKGNTAAITGDQVALTNIRIM
ncbi:MAG: hypothetical protein K6A69_08630 [Lachnospiraceae bacterium]|nr:hypothetical protein [Lachnospiraceae bacterium]